MRSSYESLLTSQDTLSCLSKYKADSPIRILIAGACEGLNTDITLNYSLHHVARQTTPGEPGFIYDDL